MHRYWHLRARLESMGSAGERARYVAGFAPAYAAEWARERLEARELRDLLCRARNGRDVCVDLDDPDPLVTVLIPTYNRGQLLADRAIQSALNQTHANIEVLVVGDQCDADTERAATSLDDPRVRFMNLGARGTYPEAPEDRWLVAGAAPVNVGMQLARGSWIAPCDDDDELTSDHISLLLDAARNQRLELVYSQALGESSTGSWTTIGSGRFRQGEVSHGSVLYAAALRFVSYSATSWKLFEPSDWNRWRRMQELGVRIGHLPTVTYRHYAEARHRP